MNGTAFSSLELRFARKFGGGAADDYGMRPTAYLLLLDGANRTLATLTNTAEERLGWHVTGNETGIDLRVVEGTAADGTVIDRALLTEACEVVYCPDEDSTPYRYGNGTKLPWLHSSNKVHQIVGLAPAGIYEEP